MLGDWAIWFRITTIAIGLGVGGCQDIHFRYVNRYITARFLS